MNNQNPPIRSVSFSLITESARREVFSAVSAAKTTLLSQFSVVTKYFLKLIKPKAHLNCQVMGSMGLLLADWSVELFRARRKKAKKAKMMEKMEKVEEMTYVGETIGEVGNTEKIVASREAETSTGEISSKLEKCSKVDPKMR